MTRVWHSKRGLHSPDGAHLGLTCTTALFHKIPDGGGMPAEEVEKIGKTAEEMQRYLDSAPSRFDDQIVYPACGMRAGGASFEAMAMAGLTPPPDWFDAYELHARVCGQRILRWMEKHPEDADRPTWSMNIPPDVMLIEQIARDRDHDDLNATGASGFQWGWAVNAAKYVLGLPPVPNSSVVEVTEIGDGDVEP